MPDAPPTRPSVSEQALLLGLIGFAKDTLGAGWSLNATRLYLLLIEAALTEKSRGLTYTELAVEAGLTDASVARALRELKAAQCIEAHAVEEDRRLVHYRVTETARLNGISRARALQEVLLTALLKPNS